MKKSLILPVLAVFTLNNAQNCIKQIVCADTVITDQNIINQLYNISDYVKAYCSTEIGTDKDTLDLKTNLNIHSSILTDILGINNKKINVENIDKNQLEEILLVIDYLLINLFNILKNNIDKVDILKLSDYLYGYKISSDNKFIVAANYTSANAQSLDIIDVANGAVTKKIQGFYSHIQISSDSKFIVASNRTSASAPSLDIIDVANGAVTKKIQGGYSNIQISSDNKFIVASSTAQSLDIIDVANGAVTKKIQGGYSNIQISSDNKFIVASSTAPSLDIIDVASGLVTKKIQSGYSNIQISSDSKFIVASSTAQSLDIIDVANGAVTKKIQGFYSDIQISSDSKFIVASNRTSASAPSLDIIDVANGAVTKKIQGGYSNIQISSDNKFIVASSTAQSLDIIDVANGAVIKKIQGFYSNIQISSDNKFIVAAIGINHNLDIIRLQTVPDYKKIADFLIKNIDIISVRHLLVEIRNKLINSESKFKQEMGNDLYDKLKNVISHELEKIITEEKQNQIRYAIESESADQSEIRRIINRCLLGEVSQNTVSFGIKVGHDLKLKLPESSKPLNLAPDGDSDLINQETFNELAKGNTFIEITRVNKGPLEHYYLTDGLNQSLKIAREDHDNDPYLHRQHFDDKDPANRQPITDRLDFVLVSPSKQIDSSAFALTKNEEIIHFLLDYISNKKFNAAELDIAQTLLNKLLK